MARYLVGLGVTTCGADGEGLGSDEAETLALSWTILDRLSPAGSLATHTRVVQPRDLAKVDWEAALAKTGLGEAELRQAPQLHEALAEWESLVAALEGADPASLLFVTDGQLPLRQVLHPETSKKDISLPENYWAFFDIRKEFGKAMGKESVGVGESLADIMSLLALDSEVEASQTVPLAARESRDLISVSLRLIAHANATGAAVFVAPEQIQSRLVAGVCARDSDVDENTIVRARGLPWQSSDLDVAKFFAGLNIAKGGVALCLSSAGRRNGEALVRFEDSVQRDLALRRHRHFMGSRYIEIYKASAADFLAVAAGDNDEVQKFLAKEAPVIIRMRGLPYDTTPQQIIEFFQREDGELVEVLEGEGGILFVNRADGRATGDAFVLLRSEEDCVKATGRQKQYIGTRYIEIFRTTTAEVQQVINNSAMESSKSGGEGSVTPGLMGGAPNAALAANGHLAAAAAAQMAAAQSLVPQQLLIQGRSRDCIRLRGLPYEAQVQHILDFLGEWAKHIVYQGVHMVFNAQGQASGEAFIQMDAEAAAHSCAEERHNKYMQIGKKQRYIEVFQCSADDMNLVLTGPGSAAQPPPPFALSPTATAAAVAPAAFAAAGHPQLAQLAFSNPAMAQALLQAQHSNILQAQMLAAQQQQQQQRLVAPVSMGGGGGGGLNSPASPNSPLAPPAPFSPLHAHQLLLAQNAALLQHQPGAAPVPHSAAGLISPTQAHNLAAAAAAHPSSHRHPSILAHSAQAQHANGAAPMDWFNAQQQPAPLL